MLIGSLSQTLTKQTLICNAYSSAQPMQDRLCSLPSTSHFMDGWMKKWVGVAEKTWGGECCLAGYYIFQDEENKSIYEVSTGANCTFASGVYSKCAESSSLHACVCVYVCLLELAWWLSVWLVWVAFQHHSCLASEPCL